MGDGTREEVEAYGPTEDQSQQQFEEEVQQWEREEREYLEWWQTLNKDTDYIKEHDNASNGHS
jgi:hypothetical protein